MDNSTFFLYSKFSGWVFFLFALIFLCFAIYLPVIIPVPIPLKFKLVFCLLILAPAYGVFYIFKTNLLPALQGYVALELDEEKLTFYLNGRIIYWRDVEDVSTGYWHGSYLSFKMRHGEPDLTVGLKWIAGTTNDILEQVQGYLDEYNSK